MKKIAFFILVFTLFAGTSVYAQNLKNGNYKGSARGYGGDISVTVSVSGGKIKNIRVTGKETRGEMAFKQMIPEITRTQSTNVDVVSGATISSQALILAINEALAKNNPEIVREWEKEAEQKKIAEEARKKREREAEEKRIAEQKRLEEEEKKKLEEEEQQRRILAEKADAERQKLIAEAINQTPVASAESEFEYELVGGRFPGIFIKKYLGTGMCIIVPEKIEDVTVTLIGGDAFDRDTLVKIVLPGTIQAAYFGGFKELREVIYEEGDGDMLSSIEGVFEDCTNLSKITIGNGRRTTIGERCFSGCTNLSEIIIPKSIKSIGKEAFRGSGLKSITFPNTMTISTKEGMSGEFAIGTAAFADCNSLTSVTLSDGIIRIRFGSNAFLNCSSLLDFIIPASLREARFEYEVIERKVTYGGGFSIPVYDNVYNSFKGCTKLRLTAKAKLLELGYSSEF